ncbi:MAG: hypothetical protein R2712_05150 [Vicinamibacterales bacterium]
MQALEAAARLNGSLDELAAALAAPDADAMLAAESTLASTLDAVSAVQPATPAEHDAVLAAVARARATLARCRILGASILTPRA